MGLLSLYYPSRWEFLFEEIFDLFLCCNFQYRVALSLEDSCLLLKWEGFYLTFLCTQAPGRSVDAIREPACDPLTINCYSGSPVRFHGLLCIQNRMLVASPRLVLIAPVLHRHVHLYGPHSIMAFYTLSINDQKTNRQPPLRLSLVLLLEYTPSEEFWILEAIFFHKSMQLLS